MTANKPDQVRAFSPTEGDNCVHGGWNKAETVRIAGQVTGPDDVIESREHELTSCR